MLTVLVPLLMLIALVPLLMSVRHPVLVMLLHFLLVTSLVLQPAQYISCCPKRKLNHFLPSTSRFFFKSESGSSFEFEFCSRLSPNGLSRNGSMSSANELFLNGKIRPMKLSFHLKMPQVLVPLVDLDEGDDELREADSTSMR
ncbi:uncharacterized protein Fot_15372 [Forsythia ovata]|uniref:Uncharacterized protein n=1 Tax=Forsythia ovata TaxID=205694 RepID=A0ABD1W919_9LAMI